MITNPKFTHTAGNFRGLTIPEENYTLAGYAALIHAFDLRIPLPRHLFVISSQNKRYSHNEWHIFPASYRPEDTIVSHLTFAMKYEGIDLTVLQALFSCMDDEEIAAWVHREPSGRYSRRAWFFYEWIMEKTLDVPDAQAGNFVEALDTDMQYGGVSHNLSRYRVRNNLPGVRNFCPLIWKTEKLDNFMSMRLDTVAREKTGSIHADVLARAAAFLLLQDSRASFAIEGERPARNRAERWGKAIGQAGIHPLSIEELLRLQTIVIEDHRFMHMGLRNAGGFIGSHERSSGLPLPDHISAKWQDLDILMRGMMDAYKQNLENSPLDPVLLAAIIAFGFVFIHPFEDGNGRIHRYMIHHVLITSGFSQPGFIFPVSTVILRRIDDYRKVLESYSKPRLEFIEWTPTIKGNVEVTNETIDLYRYFDATKMAEFLYECVFETVDKILPEEINYLKKYDRMKEAINERFDMPDPLMDLLIRFLQQNEGLLSQRAKKNEFKDLTPEECQDIESLYQDIFM
ncbi:MAG: Fic family protein [Alphaproteobacteria bacterium]|nr:Fic family protein [Alphaproteobacteria bacterium]